jgi:DNA helicase-2/ATP-dependent DNA helicase PcrA
VTPEVDPTGEDPELGKVVLEEERCLDRIQQHIHAQRNEKPTRRDVDYDSQLLALRDEIGASRMEDVPPLLEQMERLQGIAARQRELHRGFVDPLSPYFGRLVLNENDRTREVLIGRSTYLDSNAGVRIVDWRDAPVSRLFYRYAEGDEYEEVFGEREVEGEVKVRRSLAIVEGRLRRIVAPQGTFLRPENGDWRRGAGTVRLQGGEGMAVRADQHHKPGTLGVGDSIDQTEDRHLREITALIDPRQFDLITKPDSGLVVIQGGAGSGKTTIGLHRMAYLAFQDRKRFRPDTMLVVVFNNALARYISQVLPALDVPGVPVKTYEAWAAKLRQTHVPGLPKEHSDETPAVVTRVKKHPAMLALIREYVANLADQVKEALCGALATNPLAVATFERAWQRGAASPLAYRLHAAMRWVKEGGGGDGAVVLSPRERHAFTREVDR